MFSVLSNSTMSHTQKGVGWYLSKAKWKRLKKRWTKESKEKDIVFCPL